MTEGGGDGATTSPPHTLKQTTPPPKKNKKKPTKQTNKTHRHTAVCLLMHCSNITPGRSKLTVADQGKTSLLL